MYGRLKNWLVGGGLYSLLDLALVGALAAVLAHWTWVALTPGAVAASTLKAPADAGSALVPVKPNLFGAAQGSAASATSTRIRLVGVVSPRAASGGRAIFAVEGAKAQTAAVGDSIAAGFVLHEVHADHALVRHDGALERFPLERRARR
jgi:hypothetical protein